jgi:hypothetical protein
LYFKAGRLTSYYILTPDSFFLILGIAFCMPVNQEGVPYGACAVLHFSCAPKMKIQFLPAFFP